jgi:hypothetical protein
VLIYQIGQDGKADVVLGKALPVLCHAELIEPVRNLLHGRTSHASFGKDIPLTGSGLFRLMRFSVNSFNFSAAWLSI